MLQRIAGGCLSLRREPPKLIRQVSGSLSFIGLALLWFVLTYGGHIRPYFLSPPHVVLATLWQMLHETSFQQDIAYSVLRITLGFLASVLLAFPLGVLVGTYRIFDALIMPVVSFVRYLPVPALLPFCILWFGIGEIEKIAVVFIGVFFQLVIMVADRVMAVPESFVESAYLLRLRPIQIVGHVVVPAGLPGIFEDLRVTLGWAWGWLVLAELVGASKGLGFVIIRSQRFLANAEMIASLVLIGILGLMFDMILVGLSKLLFRWRSP